MRRPLWEDVAIVLIIALLVALAVSATARSQSLHAARASVFVVHDEPRLGCWPWLPRLLTPAVPVVAHKSLPCGTRVRICYRRCVVAVVRDRGPYVAGREFDLDVRTQRLIGAPFGVPRILWRKL